VIHVPNRGAYAARNLALNHVCGKYVAFVDADDWVDPRMFETLLNLLLEFDADIAQCELKNEGEYVQIRSREYGKPVVFSREELVGAFFDEGIAHGLLGKLFRREIWKERRFDENYYHVDAMTMATVQEFCSCFVRTDAPLYHYNTTGPGITRGTRNPLHIKSKERLFEVFSKAAEGAPVAGSFFICREIPSTGRLICPGGRISRKMAVEHIRKMRVIFARHWREAKKAEDYSAAPLAKKILWNLFLYAPMCASYLALTYSRVKRTVFR